MSIVEVFRRLELDTRQSIQAADGPIDAHWTLIARYPLGKNCEPRSD